MASHSELLPDARRVLVVGAGAAGRAVAGAASVAGAHVALLDKAESIAPGLPASVHPLPGAFAVDLVVDEGRLVGVLLLDAGILRVLRASSVVLATGGISGLFVPSPATGDGLAIAARAGVRLDGLDRLAFDGNSVRLDGGIAVDADGRASLPGLFAAGSAAFPRPDPARVARAAAAAVGLPPAPGHLRMRPAIDEPLPPGFVDVKLDRLRRTMRETWEEPEKAIPLVLRLKGEADDFARARPQPELYELQDACEAAMLLLKARRG